jgi:hypothetical protein
MISIGSDGSEDHDATKWNLDSESLRQWEVRLLRCSGIGARAITGFRTRRPLTG